MRDGAISYYHYSSSEVRVLTYCRCAHGCVLIKIATTNSWYVFKFETQIDNIHKRTNTYVINISSLYYVQMCKHLALRTYWNWTVNTHVTCWTKWCLLQGMVSSKLQPIFEFEVTTIHASIFSLMSMCDQMGSVPIQFISLSLNRTWNVWPRNLEMHDSEFVRLRSPMQRASRHVYNALIVIDVKHTQLRLWLCTRCYGFVCGNCHAAACTKRCGYLLKTQHWAMWTTHVFNSSIKQDVILSVRNQQ